jgi:UDP-glucose 4-epimerase
MKVLITGGAGFIGSAIIPELKKFGYEIYVIDNLSFGKREFIDIPDSNFFHADIRNNAPIQEIFKNVQPGVIIHLAAVHFIPYCNEHPFESADINIRGTINVLNACKNIQSVKKFFLASTAAVYPIINEPISETIPPQPLDIYGLSKLAAEHLCKEFYLETNIQTLVCRFFNAFGPNETNPHLIPEIERQIKSGKRILQLGNLTPKRDFIHTYDMARAVRLLLQLENNKYEIYNLGRGIEYSVKEIVEAFEQQLNEKLTIEIDPARVRKIERMHLLADVSKLKLHTGWEPEWSIEEGIKNLLEN